MYRFRWPFVLLIVLFSFAVLRGQSPPIDLLPGSALARELKGGDIHRYALQLSADQYVHLRIEQPVVRLNARMIGTDGATLFDVKSAKDKPDEIGIFFVPETTGTYGIEVSPVDAAVPAGSYKIDLVESRPATTADKDAASLFIGNRARYYFSVDNHHCRVLAKRSLELAQAAGNQRIIASDLSLIANTYHMEGDLTKGLELHLKALEIRRAINDIGGIAGSLNNLGIMYASLGSAEESVASFQKAYEMMLKIGDKQDVALSLYNIGNVYSERGDISKAMTYFQRSSSMYAEAGVIPMPASLAINFAEAYRRQGNYDQAIRYFSEAQTRGISAKHPYTIFLAYHGLGKTYLETGSYSKAIEALLKALETEKVMNSNSGSVEMLRAVGDAYMMSGDLTKAEDYYKKSLEAAGKSVAFRPIVSLKTAMANLRLRQGNTGDAVKWAEEARSTFEGNAGHGSDPELYTTLGRVYMAVGDREHSKHAFQSAVRDAEALRDIWGSAVDESLAKYFEKQIAPYYSLVQLYSSEGLVKDAFNFSELMRSRTLVDAFHGARINIDGALTPTEIAQETSLRRQLTSLNEQLKNASADKRPVVSAELETKRLELDDFRSRVYAAHPELKTLRGKMNPITLDETSEIISDKTAVVEYAVADSGTLLFVLTKSGAVPSLKAYSIDIKKNDLADRIEVLRSKIAKGDLDFSGEARGLYDLLVRPAAAQLANKTSMVIMPDGPLWNLPFQTLQPSGGQYLIEQAAVSYAPSVTALREMQKKNRGKKTLDASLLAFGNPAVNKETSDKLKAVFMDESLEPLPEAERLVNTLGKMYGPARSKVYTGVEAREQAAKTEAPKYRIVQFATHGILNNISPMYSHLLLSQKRDDPNEDGLLEAWELKDLDLKADMVILSACDTARGRISNGEGVIGMTWAAFIAGAPTTVASQWKVESKSTTELMLEFHRQLLTGRVSKAEALRRAELKVMKMPGYKHPSYWAGFVVVGDGS